MLFLEIPQFWALIDILVFICMIPSVGLSRYGGHITALTIAIARVAPMATSAELQDSLLAKLIETSLKSLMPRPSSLEDNQIIQQSTTTITNENKIINFNDCKT